MYLNIRYSLLVPYRQQLQETRVPKCQLTSLITSIFLPLIHRCPPLDECFNPLAVPKLCEEKEKKTQLNFYHFGRQNGWCLFCEGGPMKCQDRDLLLSYKKQRSLARLMCLGLLRQINAGFNTDLHLTRAIRASFYWSM